MKDNPYQLAGILAIIYAVLFPLAFVIGLVQQTVLSVKTFSHMPVIGPADGLMIIGSIMMIYVYLRFKDMLNSRYNYNRLDKLILLSIWWLIVFQIGELMLKGVLMALHPVDKITFLAIQVPYLVVSMLSVGIIDLFIASRLLKDGDHLNELIKVFAYVSLIAGIAEVTVIGSLISVILVPVSCVVLGMVMMREKEELEFV